MVYIDEQFLFNHMGPTVVSSCLVYGGVTLDQTASLLSSVISESCDYVDSAFDSGGYSVPLTGTVPFIVKKTAASMATYFMFLKVGVVDTALQNQVTFVADSADGWLQMVADGRRKIPGYNPTTAGASQGGHVGGPPSTDADDVQNSGPFSTRRLKGTLL